MSSTIGFINLNKDDQMQIYGYKLNRFKRFITWIFIVLSLGLLRLIFSWKPEWMVYCTRDQCTLEEADIVLLVDNYDQVFIESVVDSSDQEHDWIVPSANGQFNKVNRFRYIENKKTRYIWNFQMKCFEKLTGLDFGTIQCAQFYSHPILSKNEMNKRINLFGRNVIEVNVESIMKIFVVEVLNPFYIYQLFAIIFWAADGYYYYASYIVFMSLVSLTISTYQIQVNQKKLRDKVYSTDDVLVCRQNSSSERISSSLLVPGDIILLENETGQLHCDAVLLSGEVIVDESMLTGESNPVTKTPIRNDREVYDHRKDTKHILFSGTSVLQVRPTGSKPTRALVIRTNFQTAKGELVRSILFPKPIDFKFNRHISHFLSAMAVLALAGFVYTVVLKIRRRDSVSEILFKALDLITIVVPPELPAALTIATIFVEKRLRKQKIFCMSPRSINISGCIDCVVFDKTGTLTENDVDIEEVLQVEHIDQTSESHFTKPIKQLKDINEQSYVSHCLATCHSLKLLNDNFIGENLEIKMFNSTNWTLFEPKQSEMNDDCLVPTMVKSPSGGISLGVLKQFPFTSKSARMSVIVKQLNQDSERNLCFYIKGAPEVVVKMCKSKTVPSDFNFILNEYTRKSYRVLAIAFKKLSNLSSVEVEQNQMEYYENDLVFLGLVVMKNMLKSSTQNTIQTLNHANIRIIMATGDNLMTALSVGSECGITNPCDDIVVIESNQTDIRPSIKWHFMNPNTGSVNKHQNGFDSIIMGFNENYKLAMTGYTFQVLREHYQDLLPKIVVRCAIYARMSPEQKQQLVELLQSIGYYVSMCGDGANDCGALKVAHAGISLSDTEASVASPFTSSTGEISCVVDLLREGRASLVSVFGIVRYMACYNITTFLAICILYYYYSALTDIQNLYQDVVIISLYVFLFGRTHPYHKLSRTRPPTSLIGLTQFSSIVLQLTLVAIFQAITVIYLHRQPWFVPHRATAVDDAEDKDYVCHDNYALFIAQVFQYITLVIVFSKSAPYRKPIYKNKLLSVAILVTTLLTLYIVLIPEYPFASVAEFFGLDYESFPFDFRFQLVGLNVIHLIVALLAEKIIIENFIRKISQKYKRNFYDKIHKATCQLDWLSN